MSDLVMSRFLVRFAGRPKDGGKGRTYIRMSFDAVTETERKVIREKQIERWTEEGPKVTVGIPADVKVKNRNVSSANRLQVLIG